MTQINHPSWFVSVLVGFLITGIFPSLNATDVNFNKFVEEIAIKGDLRLRHENFNWTDKAGQPDRQRQRLRLRVGLDVKLPNNLAVKTRLATSEDQDQISSNQTLTNNANPKGIYLDRAFLTWAPVDALMFQAGKMANPFWQTYASDIMWDIDYNPEGLSEGYSSLFGGVKMFANAGQFSIKERDKNPRDAYQFAEQFGGQIKLPFGSELALGLAHHEFVNISSSTNAPIPPNDIGGKNSLNTNTSPYQFSILEFTSAINSLIVRIPVAFEFTFLKNLAAPESTIGGTTKARDQGHQEGIKIGSKKNPGDWQMAFFYKSLEKDAAVAGITDAEWEGTNRKGYLAWISYLLSEPISFQIKYFFP